MNRINRLRAQAENNFRNFDGVVYGNKGYRNAVAGPSFAAVEVLDPNDRTWTITVANSDTAAHSAMLFGAAKDLTDATLDSRVTITVTESSHLEVKSEILGAPVRILGLKYTVTSAAQFSNALTLVDSTSTGALNQRKWQPLNYRSAQNTLTTQVDAPTFEMLVSSTSYITFTINASETVTFTFTIVEKAMSRNLLRNVSQVAASNTMAPTGLPQIDLKRGL